MNKSTVDRLRELGFIRAVEAAPIVGRSPGGNIPELLKKHGVRYLSVPCGESGRLIDLFQKDDLPKVPKIEPESPAQLSLPVGGATNGGKLLARLVALEEALSSLSDRVLELETRP